MQPKSQADSTKAVAEATKAQADNTQRLATAANIQADAARSAAATAKGALNLSVQSFHVSERPYLTADSIRFDAALDQKHNPVIVKLEWHNAGRTPALKALVQIHALINGKETANLPGDFPLEMTIASDRNAGAHFSIWIREPGDFEGIVDGTRKLSIKGSIEYSDIFKESHLTTICAVYDSKVTKEWLYCPGNDVK